MSFVGLGLGWLGLVGVFAGLMARDVRKSRRQSEALLARIEQSPCDIEFVQLYDTEPVEIAVQFYEAGLHKISTVTGVAAVRLFDQIRSAAPNARYSCPGETCS